MNNMNKELIMNVKEYVISIDYQIDSVFALLLAIDNDNHTHAIKFYNYYSNRDGYKTDEDIYYDLIKMIKNYKHHKITIVVEPDAASLIECIKRHNEFGLIINNLNIPERHK